MEELIQDIEEAVRILLAGRTRKIEGKGFTAYTIGDNLIRVDIRTAEVQRD